MHYAIQWYDPHDLTPAGRAKKDGEPKGDFPTKQAAEQKADADCDYYGIYLPYRIVSVEN